MWRSAATCIVGISVLTLSGCQTPKRGGITGDHCIKGLEASAYSTLDVTSRSEATKMVREALGRSEQEYQEKKEQGGGSGWVKIIDFLEAGGGGGGSEEFRSELRRQFKSQGESALSDKLFLSLAERTVNEKALAAFEHCLDVAAQNPPDPVSFESQEHPDSSLLTIRTDDEQPFKVLQLVTTGGDATGPGLEEGRTYPSGYTLTVAGKPGASVGVVLLTNVGTAKYSRSWPALGGTDKGASKKATGPASTKGATKKATPPKRTAFVARGEGRYARGEGGTRGGLRRTTVPRGQRVVGVVVFGEPWVNGIELIASDNKSYLLGADVGKRWPITFEPREKLIGLTGKVSNEVDQVSLVTNVRTYGPFGATEKQVSKRRHVTDFRVLSPENNEIVGLYGRQRNVMQSVGMIVESAEAR